MAHFEEVFSSIELPFAWRTYWITSGLFGVIIGAYIISKVIIGPFGKILAFIVMFFGIGLIGLWLLALAITSM